jgi:hypothetical protein
MLFRPDRPLERTETTKLVLPLQPTEYHAIARGRASLNMSMYLAGVGTHQPYPIPMDMSTSSQLKIHTTRLYAHGWVQPSFLLLGYLARGRNIN